MARLQGGASRSEAPPSGGPSRKAPAATGLRSRTVEIPRSVRASGNWLELLLPAEARRAPGGVEGPGVCAPVAWSAALPAFCLLLPSKASFLSNPPFWGVGICFNPTSPFARLYRPRAQTAPLGFLARGDQGPSKGQRRAQRRRLFSSSPRRISQAREVGPAYRGAVTKKGLSLAGALGGARCSRVTRGSARASSKVEPADCRAARPRAPPPPRSATHTHPRPVSATKQRGQERDCRELRSARLATFSPLVTLGYGAPERPGGKLTFCSSLEQGSLRMPAQMASWVGKATVGRNFGKMMPPFGARLC
ncbi:uncharacterized protein LOC131381543 [Hylobates moloch]|uniref:uncharacterized protein LOC131381543 n=1 Tax=Hylobates moloch TaxID=81572 RepID=UPI00267546CC|nr:uncharacterized protein LOC131381543 [Hylobates moloch]